MQDKKKKKERRKLEREREGKKERKKETNKQTNTVLERAHYTGYSTVLALPIQDKLVLHNACFCKDCQMGLEKLIPSPSSTGSQLYTQQPVRRRQPAQVRPVMQIRGSRPEASDKSLLVSAS